MLMPWPGTAAAPLSIAPPAPAAHLLGIDYREPGLAPSRALFVWSARAEESRQSDVVCSDMRGFIPVGIERLRRGTEGGCGGTRSRLRSRSLRKTRPLTCPPGYT